MDDMKMIEILKYLNDTVDFEELNNLFPQHAKAKENLEILLDINDRHLDRNRNGILRHAYFAGEMPNYPDIRMSPDKNAEDNLICSLVTRESKYDVSKKYIPKLKGTIGRLKKGYEALDNLQNASQDGIVEYLFDKLPEEYKGYEEEAIAAINLLSLGSTRQEVYLPCFDGKYIPNFRNNHVYGVDGYSLSLNTLEKLLDTMINYVEIK